MGRLLENCSHVDLRIIYVQYRCIYCSNVIVEFAQSCSKRQSEADGYLEAGVEMHNCVYPRLMHGINTNY